MGIFGNTICNKHFIIQAQKVHEIIRRKHCSYPQREKWPDAKFQTKKIIENIKTVCIFNAMNYRSLGQHDWLKEDILMIYFY